MALGVGEYRSGGRVWDADGREVIAAVGEDGLPLDLTGGGGGASGVLLDEQMLEDPSANYTVTGGAIAYDATDDFIRPSASGVDLYLTRNDDVALEAIRNPFVALELKANAGAGTPIINVNLREQADRGVIVQMHAGNVHIFTDSPGAVGTLRANTAVAFASLDHFWLTAGVFQDQAFALVSQFPPAMHPLASTMGVFARVTYALSGIAGTPFADPYRTGKANKVRLSPGTSDHANHRIYRHIVADLDLAPVF